MTVQPLIVFLLLIIHLHAYPIDEIVQQNNVRQRRSVDLMSWQSALTLFRQLYSNENDRMKRSEAPREYQPLEGPINIEQLPAMLASRNVKRYPYSQQNDPAIIG